MAEREDEEAISPRRHWEEHQAVREWMVERRERRKFWRETLIRLLLTMLGILGSGALYLFWNGARSLLSGVTSP